MNNYIARKGERPIIPANLLSFLNPINGTELLSNIILTYNLHANNVISVDESMQDQKNFCPIRICEVFTSYYEQRLLENKGKVIYLILEGVRQYEVHVPA